MKKIEAIVRSGQRDAVVAAIKKVGVGGVQSLQLRRDASAEKICWNHLAQILSAEDCHTRGLPRNCGVLIQRTFSLTAIPAQANSKPIASQTCG